MAITLYYNAKKYDDEKVIGGVQPGSIWIDSLNSYGFAVKNGTEVKEEWSDGDAPLANYWVGSLFSKPTGYDYPDVASAYYILNITQDKWLSGTYRSDYIDFQPLFDLGYVADGDHLYLFPNWKANTYTITYYANGGSGAPATQYKTHGDTTFKLSSREPKWSGQTFSSWNTKDDGTGKTYTPGQAYTGNANLTLYAIWEFTITYNLNGGSGTFEPQTGYTGKAISVRSTKPSRTGHIFVNWNTRIQGNGVDYDPGESYNEGVSVNLYAMWTPRGYTISFDSNGGQGNIPSLTQYYGTAIQLTGATPTRTGYTFDHWESKDGSVSANNNGSIMPNKSVKLYAQWKPNKYTITYDRNDGSGGQFTQPAEQGKAVQIVSALSGYAGHTFRIWRDLVAGKDYEPGVSYTINGSLTLTAQWDALKINIKYNANGKKNVSNMPADDTKDWGDQNYHLSSKEPSVDGYDFLGWAITASGPKVYDPGNVYAQNTDLTLYACWDPNKYTISFVAPNASNIPQNIQKTQDIDIKIPNVTPQKAGYTFQGWTLTSESSTVNYKIDDTFKLNDDTTLYAVFKANEQIYITFNANGGSSAPSAQHDNKGKKLTLTSAKATKNSETKPVTVTYDPVLDGAVIKRGNVPVSSDSCSITISYTFVCWNTKANGTGTTYKPKDQIDLTANMTLYAQYEKKYSGSVILPTGTLEQYVLSGWSVSGTTSALVAKPDDPYTPTESITLYAVWAPNGFGGMLKFPASGIPEGMDEGSQVRLFGMKDPNNDKLYTIASRSYSDGIVTVYFAENFFSSGEQDAGEDNLMIYGAGTFVPEMDYICSINNRLWGCSSASRTIYASALGDPTDFWKLDGLATGSYQVPVGTAGDFTGCVALNSSVLFFKQHCIHKVLGGFPAEYSLYTYEINGISEGNYRSVKNCEGMAIYVTEHGIGTYSGADAGLLSKELGAGNMNNALAEYNGQKYALSYEDDEGVPHTYIYDIRYKMWLEEVFGKVMSFAHLVDEDYVLVEDSERNAIYRLTTGEVDPDVEWEITFKPYIEMLTGSYGSRSHIFEKKRYTGITLRVELPPGSYIRAELKADEQPWEIAGRVQGNPRYGVTQMHIHTPRCDKLQLRLSGRGPMTILAMDREYIIGSRR